MNLFTYGSLMSPDIMEEVSGGQFASYNAVAEGFQRFCVRHEPYPGMVGSSAGKVEGVVYEGLDSAAMHRLDIFEGEMYVRLPIQVRRTKDNFAMEVMAYIVKLDYQHMLTQEIWNYEKFLAEGKRIFTEQYMGFRDIEEE